MKKVFLLLAVFAVTAVFASEAAVKKMIMDYRIADAEFELKSLDYLTDDFSGSILGKAVDKQKLKDAYHCMTVMMTTDDLEVFMENALKVQGQQFNDAQRKQIQSMKNTDQGKALLKIGKTQLENLQKSARDGLKTLTFKEVKVNGDLADVTLEFLDPTNAKTWQCKYSLVKKDGKWLIKGMLLALPK